MRNLILAGAIAATLMPAAASAQWHDQRNDIRHDRRELRHDRRELREDRRELAHDRGYAAPYGGWRYRPVTTGYQLRPAFYGQRYWVSDYGRFHVQPPRPNLRWVRYGNDLLLVNVRNGRVLEVRHDIGW